MNQLRVALNKLPPGATIKILRKVFNLPSPAARLLLHDITKPRSSHKPWIYRVAWNNEWSGCWVGENIHKLDKASLIKRINDCDVVLFNVHGGGFRTGTCTMFMDTWIEWIKVLRSNYGMETVIMSVDHRLAPECKYPGPVEDVVRAYNHLTKTLQVDAEKIIVTGDSSGAALILEMLFITHDPSLFESITDGNDKSNGSGDAGSMPKASQLPRPAGAVFSSPLVTDETTSESWRTNVKYDYISQYTAKVIKKDYFEPLGPESPPDANQILGIAKLETGFKDFLPQQVLMFVGNKETLRDDALDLAMRAENDGVNWETVIEDCVHDWFCVKEVVKDKRILLHANAIFADFCHRSVCGIPYKSSAAIRFLTATNRGYNSYTKVLYETNRSNANENSSDYLLMQRSNEGLEAVIEEEEDEEDETTASFKDLLDNSDLSDNDFDLPFSKASYGKKHVKATVIPGNNKNQKPKTIFV